jgi:DNA-binding MarR family transcriptional regulator
MSKSSQEQLAALNRLYKEQNVLYHSFAMKFGFSDTAFWILYALCENEKEYTQNDFCKEWSFAKQTVNSAINRLMEDHYIELEVIPGTKNSKHVKLTEYGYQQCQKNMIPLILAEQKAFSRFSETELESFLTLFKKQIDLVKEEVEKII